MFISKLVSATVTVMATCSAMSAPARTYGIPIQFAPETSTTWSVYTCPDKAQCQVTVKISIVSGDCVFSVEDFIDRHENRKRQEIVWNLISNTTGYDVEFADAGISMTFGSNDVDEGASEKKSHSKKIKQQDNRLLLYDILAKYKNSRDQDLPGNWTRCEPKGPAIVNRG